MGCFGDREKGELEDSQKWAYVTLSDFKASGALAYFSYGWLWFLSLVAVAVYGADTFTAVNLLAYDKWSSQIEPAIPLKYSKWIFAACIFVSWGLCAFEVVRGIRVIRRGSVAESYMDPFAVKLQSMRPQGWKRFLVFAELTKSKKGVDYIALFVYFSFQGALRIILAEAPRQVINAITLYSVLQADIVPTGDHATTSGHSSIEQFFLNIETLAETNEEQAVVLFTMLFTLVIWVISALSLIAAIVLYLTFLWHYIPQEDGRLSVYCKRKIDRRLSKIVGAKVKQALEDQEKERMREEVKASKTKGGQTGRPTAARQPTLPQLSGTTPRFNDNKLPEFKLARQDSEATLPEYSSQAPSTRNEQSDFPRKPVLPREPTLPDVQEPNMRPGMPSRSGTEASNASYSSNAPLLDNATEMGYADDKRDYPAHPRPVFDRQGSSSYGSRPVPDRQMSSSTQGQRRLPDRQMSSSTNGFRPVLDRQMSSSPATRLLPDLQDSYGPGSNIDRELSASPYGQMPGRQMSGTPLGTRPEISMSASPLGPTTVPARQMTASPYSQFSGPERQISASPLSQMSGPNRQGTASPYGGRPVPDRQMSAASYMSRQPPMRTMTPLTEVSSHVSSTTGTIESPTYGAYQGNYTPVNGSVLPPSSQSISHQLNYAPVQGSVPHPPTAPEQCQGTYTPVYGSIAQQKTQNSTSPVDEPLAQRQDNQSLYRPFSPPSHAAPAMPFTNRHNQDFSVGESFEMTSRPTTAPSTSSYPSFNQTRDYVPFNPLYSSTTKAGMPTRNITTPTNALIAQSQYVPQRSATAPPETNTYEDIIDEYGQNRESYRVVRRATAGPGDYEHERP